MLVGELLVDMLLIGVLLVEVLLVGELLVGMLLVGELMSMVLVGILMCMVAVIVLVSMVVGLAQSKLLLGTKGDEQFPTQLSFSKKLQQPLTKRLKHLIRLGCVVLQAELQDPQCWSLLVIVANPDLAGLTHTPQSVLRVVDKVPFGGVVMMLEVLPSTLAVQVGPVAHSNSN